MVHQVNFAGRRVGKFHRVERLRREFVKQTQRAHDVPGLRALHAEQAVVRRDVHDLHVIGDNVFLQSLHDGWREAGFEVEEQFILQREDVQVALHLALRRDERGVTTLADAEAFHIVGDLAVEEPGAVIADETEAGTGAEIEHAGGFAQGMVFGEPVAVAGRNIRAIGRAQAGGAGLEPLAAISASIFFWQPGQMPWERVASEFALIYCSTLCQ